MSDLVIPAGWRPMWEFPEPGRKRRFLFDTPLGPAPSDLPAYKWGAETLTPVAWRYA